MKPILFKGRYGDRKFKDELQKLLNYITENTTKEEEKEEKKVKTNKERTKVGDIRMNKGLPEICVQITYNRSVCEDDNIELKWEDYEEHLLHTRMGMSPESHQLHSLQHFVDVLDVNQPIRQKDTIKIRKSLYCKPVRPLVPKPGGKEPGCTKSRWNIL